jgi:PAS domain S-box-containing protein
MQTPPASLSSGQRKKSSPSHYKDQLLCELELQQTVFTAQLDKIRQKLEETEESFTAFYTNAPIGCLTLTPKGLVANANAAAISLFRMDEARLKHLPFSLLVHRGDVRLFMRHLAQCKQSEGQKVKTELRLRLPVDEPRRIQLISVPVAGAGQPSFLTVVVDVSDRIRSEQELAEAKDFSESIVEAVNQPLVVLDADLKIVSINRAFSEFFRQSTEHVQGRVFEVVLNLWWSGNVLRTELEKVLVRGQPLERFQVTTELRDSGKRTLLLNARRLTRKQNSRPLILVALEDITTRVQAEEQLRQLNQELESRVAARTDALKKSNEHMESFCYSIAHDLRAPLRSMTGFSCILLDDYVSQLAPPGRDYLSRIHQSAQQMDRLIQDLLNYGRLNSAGFEIQDVDVEETFRTVLARHNQEFKDKRAKVVKKGVLPRVRGYPTLFETVLTNLILNAIKFMAPGVQPAISIRSEDRGSFSRIWVEDNGIGISPENRTKIFGVFQRLHAADRYPGTGIGLAIVHKGIERMGGQVGVESELHKGSRFWIELRKAENVR